MITIFNRCELCITTSMEEQNRIRTILSNNNIDYTVKTTNLLSPSPFARGHNTTGTFGINMNQVYEYKIYVHNKDFEEATYLINKR